MRHTLRRSLLLACAVAGAACGGDDGGGPVVPPPGGQGFSATGGAGQSAIAGTTLPVPYTVHVTDEADAAGAGATIHWTAGTAAGTLSASTSVTDAAGHASVLHTLGAGTGSQTVSASIDGSSADAGGVQRDRAGRGAGGARGACCPIPPNYGIHDTFVRDGLAFVSAWDTGLIIYDVGNGIRGGSPSAPIEVSRIVPPPRRRSADMVGSIHNAWWFHNPGQRARSATCSWGRKDPASSATRRGATSTRWTCPTWRIRRWSGASAWRARARTISGWTRRHRCCTRPTTMAAWSRSTCPARCRATCRRGLSRRCEPGGPDSTFTWGVQLANGSIYASDMLTWVCGGSRRRRAVSRCWAGGRNVLERYTSDLWVQGAFAFTGTWGTRTRQHRPAERRECAEGLVAARLGGRRSSRTR